jgi:hypothetical protein
MNQAGLAGLGYMASSEEGYRALLAADAKVEGSPQHWDIMRDRDAWRKGKSAPTPRSTAAPAAPTAPTSTAPATPKLSPSSSTTPPRTAYPTYTAPAPRPRRQSSLAPLSTLFPGSAQAQTAALRQQVAQTAYGRQAPAASVGRSSWSSFVPAIVLVSLGVFGLAMIRRAESRKGK